MDQYDNLEEIEQYMAGMDLNNVELVFCERFDGKSRIWNFKKHRHDYVEIIYFIEGRANISAMEEILKLNIHNIVLYPEDCDHQEILDMRFHQDVICLGIKADATKKLGYPFKITDKKGDLKWLFEKVHFEYTNKLDCSTDIIPLYLKAIFHLIRRSFRYGRTKEYNIVDHAADHIKNNLGKELNVDNIAASVHISPSYLTRLFRKEMGITPMKYANYLRTDTAKRLLIQENYSIAQISELVGYKDQKYFSRAFKNNTGLTPSQFRNLEG